jgi:hypothetical protein
MQAILTLRMCILSSLLQTQLVARPHTSGCAGFAFYRHYGEAELSCRLHENIGGKKEVPKKRPLLYEAGA